LEQWQKEGRVVAVCPEMLGGLPVPRPPAEISCGGSGAQVLEGKARVVDVQGKDVSEAFVKGACEVVALAKRHSARMAILKEGSPSCGSARIYDGTFGGVKVAGEGVCASALRKAGIAVFSENQLEEAWIYLTPSKA
jgi:uncharacterized protein YbbK (DUF523 family)